MSGYVYLLKCQEFYKIGIATDVHKRISGMQTGSPFTISLVASVEVDSPLALEKELHAMYSHRHHRREWFALTDEDVNAIRSLFRDPTLTADTTSHPAQAPAKDVNIWPSFIVIAIAMATMAGLMLFSGAKLIDVFPVVSVFGGMLVLLATIAVKLGVIPVD